MKRTKMEKGITLIALIITIVVLLILAAVTISTIGDEDGIITKAQEAASKYNTAQDNQKKELSNYAAFIQQYQGDTGGSAGTTEKVEVAAGSYVTYKGLTWRVIKDDASGVELLSENALSGSVSISGTSPGDWVTMYENTTAACQDKLGIEVNPYSGVVRNVKYDDINLISQLGLLASADGSEYFIGDCNIIRNEDNTSSDVNIYYVNSNGNVETVTTVKVTYLSDGGEDQNPLVSNISKQVRPIYTLQAGALDNVTGSGTSGQPYVLN